MPPPLSRTMSTTDARESGDQDVIEPVEPFQQEYVDAIGVNNVDQPLASMGNRMTLAWIHFIGFNWDCM